MWPEVELDALADGKGVQGEDEVGENEDDSERGVRVEREGAGTRGHVRDKEGEKGRKGGVYIEVQLSDSDRKGKRMVSTCLGQRLRPNSPSERGCRQGKIRPRLALSPRAGVRRPSRGRRTRGSQRASRGSRRAQVESNPVTDRGCVEDDDDESEGDDGNVGGVEMDGNRAGKGHGVAEDGRGEVGERSS